MLAAFAGWGWAWACVVDICEVSSPSPITGRFLNLVPGPLSVDMLEIPSHSSPGTLHRKKKSHIRDHITWTMLEMTSDPGYRLQRL